MNPDARAIIAQLSLVAHPEGGFYRETFRAPLVLDGLPHGGPRSASTCIYFLLPGGAFSAFHRVRSDGTWHFYDGDALELHTLDESGAHAVHRLGRDLASGERPQHVVPAGVWQAAAPVSDRYSLVGCTVSPGFDFADFELPSREALRRVFPARAALIERFTRSA